MPTITIIKIINANNSSPDKSSNIVYTFLFSLSKYSICSFIRSKNPDLSA